MPFVGFFVRLGMKALIARNAVGSWWQGLSPRVREWAVALVLGTIVVLAGTFVHRHIAHHALDKAKAEQLAADTARFNGQLARAHADALAWRDKAAAEAAKIVQLEKENLDAETRAHAAAADALLVRGPGAAASRCRPGDPAAVPGSAGGHDSAAAAGTPAGPEVSAGDWATVPWDWLVGVVREHDDLRSEALTWRSDHARQSTLWDQLRTAPAPEPAK